MATRLLTALITALLLAGLAPALGAAEQKKKDFLLRPGENCLSATCHNRLGKQAFVHAPAASTNAGCLACHKHPDPARHRFELVAGGSGEMCSQCHENQATKEFKHVPVEAGLCTFCHDPHQSNNPKQLKLPATGELCFACHNPAKFKNEFTHGPVVKGDCLRCHNPHSADHPHVLEQAVPDLCFGCHNKQVKREDGDIIVAVKPTFDNKELKHHAPFIVGDCKFCHNPHASSHYRLLNGPYPESFYASYAPNKYICFNCHAESSHSTPRTLTDTGFRNGNLNLHYRHVNRTKGRTCRACHDHHAAERPKLIRDKVPFGQRYITIEEFELTETGGRCTPTCHSEAAYDRYNPARVSFKVTPRPGVDATPEELQRTRSSQTTSAQKNN